MNDAKKTKKQLVEGLAETRARIAELEASEAKRKRAEEALRESKELYRSVVESIDLGLNLIDCDHNIVMVNAAQGRHFNKPPHEMIGKKCFREFEKRDAVCSHCPGVRAIATGQLAEVETEGVRDDGSRFNVRLQAFPVFGQDGTVRGFIEIAQDITEQRQAEEASQRRGAVLGAIALAAEKLLRPSDWEQDIQAALAYLSKAADVERATIWEANTSDDGKCLISVRCEWIAPETKLAPLVGLQNVPVFRRWQEILPRGEVITGHVRDFGAKEQEFFVPRGIMSILVVPIFVNDAWWGFMGFDQGIAEREWMEVEIGALKTAASILGGALERKQAEEALEESGERYRTILENIEDGYFEVDVAGNLTFFNDALCRIYGYTKGELMDMNYRQYMDKETAKAAYQTFNAVYRTGKPTRAFDWEFVKKDGARVPVEASVSLIRDSTGEPVGFRGLVRDVTERKQVEAERARLQQEIIEAQERALQELSTPIIPIIDRIIVMPLVGSIDTLRAKDIMRALLAGIRTYRAKVVIVDITGVPIVDSGVANHLDKTIQAARLKGAQTIITGISDAVAEAIVDLGIDWSGVETLANLQAGLMVALSSLGIKLSKAQ